MKKIYLLVCIIMAVSLAGPAEAKKIFKTKVYHVNVPKAGWIDSFKAGSSELGEKQKKQVREIKQYLREHPKVHIYLKGSVSSEKIKGGCHTTQDGLNFFLGPGLDDENTITDEEDCEIALGLSRALQVQAELTDNNGISSARTHAFSEVDFYRRPGGNSLNRAVSYWYVELPDGVETVKLQEDPVNGNLLLDYRPGKKCLLQKFRQWWQKNIPKPHFRFKERKAKP